MEGVIVHAQHIYRGESIFSVVCGALIICLAMAWFAIEVMRGFKSSDSKRWVYMLLFFLYTVFAGVTLANSINDAHAVYHDLVVTIDDTVGFNEFYDHYEIVSQDGSLYTVREIATEETESMEAGDHAQ